MSNPYPHPPSDGSAKTYVRNPESALETVLYTTPASHDSRAGAYRRHGGRADGGLKPAV